MDGATIVIRGEQAGDVLLESKTFSTGKQGFWGQAKVVINGERYQAQVQVVKITPKNN